jgi:heavy metal-binding protein
MLFVLAIAAGAPAQPVYWCPMHPEVRGSQGDSCPICHMALVPAGPNDYRPYELDVSFTPRDVRPMQPARARFVVRDPRTHRAVRDFALVHERVFHLFIVSRDLEYFAHVHPALAPSGALGVDVTVPSAGAYQLIADFVPSGGAPQLLQKSFVTAGYRARLGAVPELAADRSDRIVRGVRVSLTMPDAVAGREQLITFDLRDEASGQPVDDLEPFLGATGHLLLASADLENVAHSHPVAAISGRAGPNVVFQHLFPRAGMYRMWAQFQRRGEVMTAAFTVPVSER